MSHHLFGSGNNLYRLDSVFNERAGPRMPGTQAERRYRHPVVPISTTDAPHYAQVRIFHRLSRILTLSTNYLLAIRLTKIILVYL
uniref:SJCHGC04827 protein n=1 Tax=Schistosoma japonicum TaxID=6182 RepID=Q5BSD8_SCHJA|nr:SJCHGC04827 protein [Schistosoma japonicum]